MRKFEPRSNIFGFKPDGLKTMAEVDSVAAEINDQYELNGATITDEQKIWRELRKCTYTFNDSATREFSGKEHTPGVWQRS